MTTTAARIADLKRSDPDMFVLSDSVAELESFFECAGFLNSHEKIRGLSKIGDGNMNYTVRVNTNFRSLVVKQARPWVEKYPQFDAPVSRSFCEAEFYREVSKFSGIRSRMPELLFYDDTSHILVFSDLFDAIDLGSVYQDENSIDRNHLEAAIDWLSALHGVKRPSSCKGDNNLLMRKLNYEHIFDFPFRENNGFDLNQVQNGLEELAQPIRSNQNLVKRIKELGHKYYLSPHEEVLLHGDFFPGSWLSKDEQLFIIDPEFMFYGQKEWDLSTLVAHIVLAGNSLVRFDDLLSIYQMVHEIDQQTIYNLAGVEILRRLLGVAQLPIPLSIEQKKSLISLAQEWVMMS